MGASLDGVPMRLNPSSVRWPYTMKYADTKTVGGKVFQLLGASLGDLTVAGKFGAGGPAEQQAMLDRIIALMDEQMPVNGPAKPVRFLWPERGWDFWCFVKKFTQTGSDVAIEASNQNFAPEYTLTLFIQEDNGSLVRTVKTAAAAAFIGRISAGLGWKQTAYNGPGNYDALSEILGGKTIWEAMMDPTWLSNYISQMAGDQTDTQTRDQAYLADIRAEGGG